MKRIMLSCGCQAHATRTIDGEQFPSCITHDCIEPAVKEPDLIGRDAKCGCGATRLSTDAIEGRLAFFEYYGPGSRWAKLRCECGYYLRAHDPKEMAKNVPSNRKTVVEQGKCSGFRACGPAEFDAYYCGCRGWD